MLSVARGSLKRLVDFSGKENFLIMGNIVKKQVDDSEPTPELRSLTQEQVEIIQRTWAIPNARPLDSGERILFTFLERNPHQMVYFHSFKNTPLLLLKGTPGFRSHASKIMNTFAVCIDSLDKPSGMTEIQKSLADVGKSHQKRKLTKRAYVELRVVLLEVLGEVCNLDEDGELAWNYLIDIIYHIIFECLDGKADQFYE